MYGAKQSADASRFGASQQRLGAENVASTQAGSANYQSDQSRIASMYGSDRTAQASMYGADANIRNTAMTGQQQRLTMGYQDQLEAGKARRQSARSRAMARSF